MERDGYGFALAETVFQLSQSQLKQAQVAADSPVDDALPAAPKYLGVQTDHPIVLQARRDQQPGQALLVCQMAVVQAEALALLVREWRRDPEAPMVPGAGLRQKVQVRHQQWLLVASLTDSPHRLQAPGRKQQVWHLHGLAVDATTRCPSGWTGGTSPPVSRPRLAVRSARCSRRSTSPPPKHRPDGLPQVEGLMIR